MCKRVLLICFLLGGFPAFAEEVTVAVAANFMLPMKALVAEFEQASGHEVTVSYGSSGRFYAQIVNGAPFDVFFSADQEKPQALIEAGQADASSRVTYAIGALVLWSADAAAEVENGALFNTSGFRALAMANPRLAPYGVAAEQVLGALAAQGVSPPLTVVGENVGQAYQFVVTGNATAGLVALSQVMENGEIKSGSGWVIPAGMYDPTRQDAVLLERGRNNRAATELLAFIRSDKAKTIMAGYGYKTD